MLFSHNKKLFLLDGMSLLYRAHYGLRHASMVTKQGIQTGAILGFINTLLEVLKHAQPTHLIVAFDNEAKTFRHQLWPTYKSHRQAQPEAISTAIGYIQAILNGFGIQWITSTGYEADDIIGTLAKKASTLGFTSYMMSTDKDLAQMVQHDIFLYKPGKYGQPAVVLGEKEVLTTWNIIRTAQVCDILALAGDTVDGIPGVPTIGIKTAQKLIKQFDNLENLLAHTDQLSGKVQTHILAYQEQALLSKQLATIFTAVPFSLDITQCNYKGPNKAQLMPLLSSLALKQIEKRLFGTMSGTATPSTDTKTPTQNIQTTHYTLIQNLSQLEHLLKKLQKAVTCSFDTETTGLDPHTARLLGIAFSIQPGEAYYVALPNEATDSFITALQKLFSQSDLLKVGHNLKYDLIVLERHGIVVAPPLFDTMVAHALVEPTMRHNLTTLAEQYCNYTPIAIESLIGAKGKTQRNMATVALEQLTQYAGEDADLTLQLYHPLTLALAAQEMASLFYQVEMPLVPLLAAMEIAGVSIDVPFLATFKTTIDTTLQTLQQEIYAAAGTAFNIHSPKQLGALLFDKLKLSAKPVKTKSGQYATGEAILTKLRYPIVTLIQTYRTWQKLRTAYVDTLPTLVHPIDQRIHTSYHQTVTATGRLSSSNPNLQNIPIKDARGRELRKAFVPHNPKDYLLSADYSQIELRVMAAYTQDATLIEAFQAGLDIHKITASKLFQVPLEEVDPSMRQQAKVANFAIIYGISAFGLAQRIPHLSKAEAAQLIENYLATFPGVKDYMEKTIAHAETYGYVTTLLGRRRWIADIHSRNRTARSMAQRMAINTPIQGSAAEMIKVAMIHIANWLKSNKLKTQMLIQVHDELVFNVPEREVPLVREAIPRLMETALPLKNVPIQVHCNMGSHWLEAHDLS